MGSSPRGVMFLARHALSRLHAILIAYPTYSQAIRSETEHPTGDHSFNCQISLLLATSKYIRQLGQCNLLPTALQICSPLPIILEELSMLQAL
jgi:hypothetical protein